MRGLFDALRDMLRSRGQRPQQLKAELERRRQAEAEAEAATRALQFTEDRFQRAVWGTTDGLWDWEVDAGHVWYAPRFAELLEYAPEELPQSFDTLEKLLHPDDRGPTMEAIQCHLQDDVPFDTEYRLQTRTGAYRWFRARGATTRDAFGKPLRMAGSIQDIHQSTIVQRSIAKRTKELSQANDELERFTYTVSHDLKSPLVTINGFLGMLQRDLNRGDTASALSRISRIEAASHRMKQLLDELLELSRIGRLVHPPEDVALTDVAQEVIEICAGSIQDRGIDVQIDPDLPVVYGDRLRLRQALQNLVENATKFTADQPYPILEIGVRKSALVQPSGERQEDHAVVVCFVRDNGVGIEPQYGELVFNLFEQLDRSGAGTGIGLTIVERIIEVHGGRVWIESEGNGQGCTVCFTLPLLPRETPCSEIRNPNI